MKDLFFILIAWVVTAQAIFSQSDANQHKQLSFEYVNSSKLDKAIFHTKKAITLYDQAEVWDSVVYMNISLSGIYYYKETLDSCRYAVEEAIKLGEKKLRPDHPFLQMAYNNLGAYYFSLNEYDLANKYYEKALLNIKGKSESEQRLKANALLNISNSFILSGSYQEALDNVNQSYQILKGLYGQNDEKTLNSYLQLGVTYNWLKEYRIAQEYFEQILKATSNKLSNINFKRLYVNAAQFLVKCKLKLGEMEKAKYWNSICREMASNGFTYRENRSLDQLSDISIEEGKLFVAVESQKLAILKFKKKYPDLNNHHIITKSFKKIGRYFFLHNQLDSALFYYNKALKSNSIDSIEVLRPLNSFILNSYKAEVYGERANKKDFKRLVETINEANLWLDITQENLKNNEDHISLVQGIKDYIYASLNSLYKAYHSDTINQSLYIETAWNLVEEIKMNGLLQGIAHRTLVNDLSIDKNLRKLIFNNDLMLKKTRSKLNSKKNETTKQGLVGDIFKLKTEKDSLLKVLKNNYPDQYIKRYRRDIVQLSELKQFSNNNTVNVNILKTDDHWYSISTCNNGNKFEQIPVGNIDSLINLHLQNLTNLEADTNQLKRFAQNAHNLYGVLFNNHKYAGIKNYNISGDNILLNFPYESLLSESPKTFNSYDIDNFHYLIKDYSINHIYAYTLSFSKDQKSQELNYNYKGFAPFANQNEKWTCNDYNLNKLPCSKQEIESAKNQLAGTSYFDGEATLNSFKLALEETRVLHLAGHSCVDEENPINSSIFFSDAQIQLKELMNVNAKNELAILNICKSASGKIRTGDGPMSLGRAFLEAGVDNVLMALWDINDCTSAIIMQEFLKLDPSDKISNKLRKAKLKYLNNSGLLKSHPYYWAYMIHVGDQLPKSRYWDRNKKMIVLGLGLFLFLFMVIAIIKKKLL